MNDNKKQEVHAIETLLLSEEEHEVEVISSYETVNNEDCCPTDVALMNVDDKTVMSVEIDREGYGEMKAADQKKIDELTISMDRFTVKFGFVDKHGKVVIPHIYEGVWPFKGDYAKVSAGRGKRGIINRKGDLIIPLAYKEIYVKNNDSAVVIDESSYQGLIDMKYGYQLPCIYYEIGIKGRNEDDNIVCEVSDGWNSHTEILKEVPFMCEDLLTKDKMPHFEGLIIDRRHKCNHCPTCGGRVASGHYRSNPDSWANLAGREGYLTICIDCGKWIDFECEIMN